MDTPVKRQADAFMSDWLSSRAIARNVNLDVMQKEDLSATLLTILHLLPRKGDTTAVALAARMNVHPSTIVRNLDTLEGRSYITRQRNPADRRELQVTLAPAGRRLRDRLEKALAKHIAEVFERMRPRDRQCLLEGFQAFVEVSSQLFGKG